VVADGSASARCPSTLALVSMVLIALVPEETGIYDDSPARHGFTVAIGASVVSAGIAPSAEASLKCRG